MHSFTVNENETTKKGRKICNSCLLHSACILFVYMLLFVSFFFLFQQTDYIRRIPLLTELISVASFRSEEMTPKIKWVRKKRKTENKHTTNSRQIRNVYWIDCVIRVAHTSKVEQFISYLCHRNPTIDFDEMRSHRFLTTTSWRLWQWGFKTDSHKTEFWSKFRCNLEN